MGSLRPFDVECGLRLAGCRRPRLNLAERALRRDEPAGRHIPDESVDLVYLDPPFHGNQDYKRPVRGSGPPCSAARSGDVCVAQRVAARRGELPGRAAVPPLHAPTCTGSWLASFSKAGARLPHNAVVARPVTCRVCAAASAEGDAFDMSPDANELVPSGNGPPRLRPRILHHAAQLLRPVPHEPHARATLQ